MLLGKLIFNHCYRQSNQTNTLKHFNREHDHKVNAVAFRKEGESYNQQSVIEPRSIAPGANMTSFS